MSKYWKTRHLDVVTGSKFQYHVQSFAMNATEEKAINAFQHRSMSGSVRLLCGSRRRMKGKLIVSLDIVVLLSCDVKF